MILLLAVVAVVAAIWLFMTMQGDAEFEFIAAQRTDFMLTEISEDKAVFACKVPFINKGRQDGTIMDAYPRHLLPYEQFDAVDVNSRLELETAQRTDNYFEAMIIPKGTGGAVIVTITFTAKEGSIKEALAKMYDMNVEMPIDIVYQVVSRTPWYITKNRIVMTPAEVKGALQSRAV